MTTDDRNKSYQDGLWNRGFDGKNWNEYSAGSFTRAEYERQQTASRQAATAAHAGQQAQPTTGTATGPVGGKAILALLLLPLVVAGIGIVAAAAVLAVFAIPVLKLSGKLLDSDEQQGFLSGYVTSFLTLSAYGLSAFAVAVVIWLLGTYVMTDTLHGLAAEIGTLYEGSLNILNASSKVPVHGPTAGALVIMQAGGLTGMLVTLRQRCARMFSGPRGLLFALATGIGMLAAIVLAVVVLSVGAAVIS